MALVRNVFASEHIQQINESDRLATGLKLCCARLVEQYDPDQWGGCGTQCRQLIVDERALIRHGAVTPCSIQHNRHVAPRLIGKINLNNKKTLNINTIWGNFKCSIHLRQRSRTCCFLLSNRGDSGCWKSFFDFDANKIRDRSGETRSMCPPMMCNHDIYWLEETIQILRLVAERIKCLDFNILLSWANEYEPDQNKAVLGGMGWFVSSR